MSKGKGQLALAYESAYEPIFEGLASPVLAGHHTEEGRAMGDG